MKSKPVRILLSLGLALAITACSSGADGTGSGLETLFDGDSEGWIDSDLTGAIKEDDDFRLQDDFAAASNKKWKLKMGDRYYDIFQDVSDAVIQKMKKCVTDESDKSVEADILRDYYALSSDWDYRNDQGVEPLKPYIEDIESIKSMDELYDFFEDSDRNPLALAPVGIGVMTSYHTKKFPDINLTMIDGPGLLLTDAYGESQYDNLNTTYGLEIYERVENRALYMLDKLGYSKKDAKKALKNCLMWEKKVSEVLEDVDMEDLEDYAVERKKAVSLTGSFRLEELLEAWGFGDVKYLVISPGFAKKLPYLCSESNLEKIKDYLVVNYCIDSSDFLDRDTYDAMEKFGKSKTKEEMDYGMTKEQQEDELQFNYYIGQTPILAAMNKVYVENYFDDSVTGELKDLTKDVIDGYKVIFSEEPWLSDKGKSLCLEKLKNIKIHIAHQNYEVLDFDKMRFRSKEEGGSFLEAYYASEKYAMYHQSFLSGQKFDRDYWDPVDPGFSTTITNAFYNASTNGIYICAGICEPCCYSPDFSYEEKLAGLCTIIGHEITHGFDSNGSIYDKNGLKNSWLPYDDQVSFNDKTDMVTAYYSNLNPYPGSGLYDGSKLTAEATADMGGLRVTLYLASKVKDFNYKKYFKSYARIWRANYPLESEKARFSSDPHPLAFYRINVGLQQFDEFYETYNVKEDDNMYLDPEDRIKVW